MRGEMIQHRAHPPHQPAERCRRPQLGGPAKGEAGGESPAPAPVSGGRRSPRPGAAAGRAARGAGMSRADPFSPSPQEPGRCLPQVLRSSEEVFYGLHLNARRDAAACSEIITLLRFTPSSHFSVHIKTLPSIYSLMSGNKSSKLCKLSTTKVIIVIELPKMSFFFFCQNVPRTSHPFQLSYNPFSCFDFFSRKNNELCCQRKKKITTIKPSESFSNTETENL